MTAALAYRRALEPDLAFVYGHWGASWRNAHAAGVISMAIYPEVQAYTITRLLARRTCFVVVAYHPGETDHVADLYGFLCAEKTARSPIVHYAYVIQSQRRQGIARGMMDEAGIDPREAFTFTHRTVMVGRLREKLPRAKYDPLCARFATAWQEDR